MKMLTNKADNADADKDTRETIYYVTDKNQQGQYIQYVQGIRYERSHP